jgi:hypothetical protein
MQLNAAQASKGSKGQNNTSKLNAVEVGEGSL